MTMIIPASVWERCTGIPLNNSTPSLWQTLWTAFTRIFLQRASLLQNLLCECQINFSVFERFTHNFLFQRWPCPAVCGLFEGISSSCWQRPGLSGNFHPPTIASGTCFLYQLCLFTDSPTSGILVAHEGGRGEAEKIQERQKRKARGQVSSIHLAFSVQHHDLFLFSGSAKESKSSKGTPKTPKIPKSSEKKEEPKDKESVKEKKNKDSSKNK